MSSALSACFNSLLYFALSRYRAMMLGGVVVER